MIWIVCILLLANAIHAVMAHRQGRLTLYVDWTDAAMTALSPFIGWIVYLGLSVVVGLSPGVANAASIGTVAIILCFGLRLTWRANGSIWAFLSAALAKYLMVFFLYLLAFAGLQGRSRRKYERLSTVKRHNTATLVSSLALWSAWMCRTPAFSPLSSWLAGNSHLWHQSDELPMDEELASD